jgi:hypothetical protein
VPALPLRLSFCVIAATSGGCRYKIVRPAREAPDHGGIGMTGLTHGLIACLRPLLTLLLITVPRWWATWSATPPPMMSTRWRARRAYEDGKEGEHP